MTAFQLPELVAGLWRLDSWGLDARATADWAAACVDEGLTAFDLGRTDIIAGKPGRGGGFHAGPRAFRQTIAKVETAIGRADGSFILP